MTQNLERATAFAPASVGNVAIGFDILGFCVDALGDRVTCTRSSKPGVRITAIKGVVEDLPLEPEKRYRVAGWAPVAEGASGEPVWDLLARRLRARKAIPAAQVNLPRLIGVKGNPGISQ